MTVISFRLRIYRHGGCTSIKDTLISVLEMKPSSRISVSYSVQYLIQFSILFGPVSYSVVNQILRGSHQKLHRQLLTELLYRIDRFHYVPNTRLTGISMICGKRMNITREIAISPIHGIDDRRTV